MEPDTVRETYENQWLVDGSWNPKGDCPSWSDVTCRETRNPKRMVLPRGWDWSDQWKVDVSSGKVDKQGWAYGESIVAFRRNKTRSKPRKEWATPMRRRRWYRPIHRRRNVGGVDMSVHEVEDLLQGVRLDLLGIKQHLRLVADLQPLLGTHEDGVSLRSSLTTAASKANMLQRKCAQRLAHPPDFAYLASETAGATEKAAVWPPPSNHASTAQGHALKAQWNGMLAEVQRIKPTVARVFRQVMAQCAPGKATDSEAGSAKSRDYADSGGGSCTAGSSTAGDAGSDSDGAVAPGQTTLPVVSNGGEQLLSQEFCLDGELRTRQELAAERAVAIRKIAADVQDTHELFEDLSMIVESQNAAVGVIDDGADRALDSMKQAVKHVEKAKADQPGCVVM